MEEITAPESFPDPVKPEPVEKEPFLNEKRRITLIYIPAILVASVIADLIIGPKSPYGTIVDIAAGLGINISGLAWCKVDARERGYQLSKHFPLFVVLLGFLTVIYYLLRSRGIGRGLISVLWLILYAVGVFAVLIIVTIAVLVPLVMAGVLPKTVFK